MPDNLPPDQTAAQNVVLSDPHGNLQNVDANEAQQALQEGGYSIPDPKAIQDADLKAKYSTVGQQIKTGLEGAASSATFGASTAAERALGVKPEDIQGRRKYNPGIHALGQIGGLAASNLVPGYGEFADAQEASQAAQKTLEGFKSAQKLVEPGSDAFKAGELATQYAGKNAEEAAQAAKESINPLSAQSVMSGTSEQAAQALGLEGVQSHAFKGAMESAIFQGGDELSKMFSSDPDQSIQSAVTNVGLAGLIGAPIGAAAGKVGDLWEAKFGGKLSQGIEDFNSRIKEHLNNPDPVGLLGDELKNRYTSDKAVFDEVYGPQGLKADAIQKLMPHELSDKMVGQAQDFLQQANHFSQEMERNPDLYPRNLSARFNRDLRIFSDSLSQPTGPADVFNSLQEFKQRMQQNYGGQFVPKVDPSHDFISGVRDLGSNIRRSLEDTETWGKAAQVQQDINKAFSEYAGGKQSPLKQFETKFTSNVNGERVIDPGKLQTYLNQTGKAGQKIKQEMLGNYLEASENYRNAINKTHEKLGIESPLSQSSLSYTKSTLQDLTPGARLADALVKKGLNRLAGETAGAAIGGGVGHLFGAGGFGALVGEHALAPFFSSVLPSLVKPLLENPNSARGLKDAVDMGLNVIKGQSLLNKATKNIFKAGQDVIPSHLIPDEKQISKLDKTLKSYQENPEKLFDVGGSMGHYLPQHGTALGQYAANAVNYLNAQRPQIDKKAPLDSEAKPTTAQQAAFNRTLRIAEQPLLVLKQLKEGTLMPKDLMDLKTLNPALYQKISSQIQESLMNHVSEEGSIPYKLRMGLSMFISQPLDSTMTPQAIQLAQASFQQNVSPTQKAPEARGGHAHSMKALSKISEIDQTPQQARQLDRVSH